MQLRSARLCLDCDEIHDAQQCPACASESFAFITRWVPVPDRPDRPLKRARPAEMASPEALGVYREMLHPEAKPGGGKWRTIQRGAMGLAIFGIAGWLWRHNARSSSAADPAADDKTRQRS
jgi:hypothetical protein